ncbi:MAG: hypothetical protein WCX74_02635 [Candidatus Paceibacterota bacterium]
MKKIYHISIIILSLIIITVGTVFVYQNNSQIIKENQGVITEKKGDSQQSSESTTQSKEKNQKDGDQIMKLVYSEQPCSPESKNKRLRYTFEVNPNSAKYVFDLYCDEEVAGYDAKCKIVVTQEGSKNIIQELKTEIGVFSYQSIIPGEYLTVYDYNHDQYNDLVIFAQLSASTIAYYDTWKFDPIQKKFVHDGIYDDKDLANGFSPFHYFNHDWKWIGHDNFWEDKTYFPNNIRIYYPKDWCFSCCSDGEGGTTHMIKNDEKNLGIEIINHFNYSWNKKNEEIEVAKVSVDEAYENHISNMPKDIKTEKVYNNNLKKEIDCYYGVDGPGSLERHGSMKETEVCYLKDNQVLTFIFVDYKKFEEGFIEEFLKKIEPEDF